MVAHNDLENMERDILNMDVSGNNDQIISSFNDGEDQLFSNF